MVQIVGMPTAMLAGLLLVFGRVLFVLSCLVLELLHRMHRRTPTVLPVAPFFVSITTVWALMLGFMGADIWAAHG